MLFLSCRKRIPSATISCRCRINIRSVISGMLRFSSLVRIGPPSSLHKIVPFHRPSITDSIESIGQGKSLSWILAYDSLSPSTDKLVSTNSCVTVRPVRICKPGAKKCIFWTRLPSVSWV